jgi:hypothetical protein
VERKEKMRRIWQDTRITSTRLATTDELNVLRRITKGLSSQAKNWAKPAARHGQHGWVGEEARPPETVRLPSTAAAAPRAS